MTRVVHVISGLGLGGAETMLVQLATRLQQRGYQQHVVSLNGLGVLADRLAQAGVQVTDLGIRSTFDLGPALIRLRRVLQETHADIVQGWMYHGNLAATFAHYAAPRRSSRRLLWNLRASNMDDARYGRIIRLSALLSKAPDITVANSEVGAAFHAAKGFSRSNLKVISNGIDTDKFRPDPVLRAELRSVYDLDESATLVIHVARVDPMKNHAGFLAAMAGLPEISAILVGAGTKALTLPPNVRALGVRTDLERLYPAADIVVSSSLFGEGFSNALAEGMSAGLVPIATDVGDSRLIVGDTGFVVAPADAPSMVSALVKVAGLETEERRKRGLLARDRIVENYAIATVVDKFQRLYSAPTQEAN